MAAIRLAPIVVDIDKPSLGLFLSGLLLRPCSELAAMLVSNSSNQAADQAYGRSVLTTSQGLNARKSAPIEIETSD